MGRWARALIRFFLTYSWPLWFCVKLSSIFPSVQERETSSDNQKLLWGNFKVFPRAPQYMMRNDVQPVCTKWQVAVPMVTMWLSLYCPDKTRIRINDPLVNMNSPNHGSSLNYSATHNSGELSAYPRVVTRSRVLWCWQVCKWCEHALQSEYISKATKIFKLRKPQA